MILGKQWEVKTNREGGPVIEKLCKGEFIKRINYGGSVQIKTAFLNGFSLEFWIKECKSSLKAVLIIDATVLILQMTKKPKKKEGWKYLNFRNSEGLTR